MPSKRKFTDEQTKKIVELYAEGHTARFIASEFSAGDATINRILREQNVEIRFRHEVSNETRRNQKIIAQIEAGKSLREVGKKFGISAQRVSFIVCRGH